MTDAVPKSGNVDAQRRWYLYDRATFVPLLFFLSGIPALIYQVAWQRQLVLLSGIGSQSVASIVACFLAGLGIGSFIGGRISKMVSPRRGLELFALTEGAVGMIGYSGYPFGNFSEFLPIEWFADSSARMALAHFLLLCVPTTLMGMTFPLLVRALVRRSQRTSRVIGRLYACNLFGAALGAFLTPWVLFPGLGISGSVVLASCVNGIVCLLGLSFRICERGKTETADADPEKMALSPKESGLTMPVSFWYLASLLTGFIGIGFEIVWFRIVDVGAKSSSFTFATVLCIYLAGLGLGTLLGERFMTGAKQPFQLFLRCQAGVAMAAVLPIVLVTRWADRMPFGRSAIAYWGNYEPLSPVHSSSFQIINLYVIFPMILFFVPTLFMGMSFVAMQDGIQTDRASAGLRLGQIQAMNILGCILGSLCIGLYGFGQFGTAGSFRLLVGSFLLIFLPCFTVPNLRRLSIAASFVCVAAIVALPDNERLWRTLHGQVPASRFLFSEDNAGVTSLILEGGSRWRVSTNGKGQSLIPFGGVHSKLGALPATLVDRPSAVAVIGLGSGDTAWAAACRKETQRIDVFEICDDQWSLLREANAATPNTQLARFLSDDRVRPVARDGRIGLRSSSRTYDFIEADAIRPNDAFAGNLYSKEFFSLCRERLTPGGVMCSWNPTPRTFETFVQVFPYVARLDGGQILIGSNDPINFDPVAWKDRLNSSHVREWLGDRIVEECVSALASVEVIRSADPTVDSARINTDLFPRDEFHSE